MSAARGRVLVTRRLPEAGLAVLAESGARVTVLQDDDECGVSPDLLRTAVRDCDVLLCLLTERIDRAVLDANPRLLGVANMAVGFDNVDVDAATALGIPVANTPGALTDTSADCAFAMLLAVARRLPQAHAYMAAGRYRIWGPNAFLGADVSPGGSGRRKVLGLVGYGRIGQAMARRARGFDMEVVVCDPTGTAEVERDGWVALSLDALLARSDFVSLHVPLNAATHHLIGAPQLARMQRGAFLINTSRGPVVDEAALVAALRARRIAGAALDVYEHEPAMAEGLAALDNVVLLPHIASASADTRGAMARMAAHNALCHLRGERAANAVNPEVYASAPYLRRREA